MNDIVKQILEAVLPIAIPTISAVIIALISAGGVLVLRKLGYEVSEAEAKRLKDEIADVVEAVEEIAKASEDKGVKLSSAEKLNLALKNAKILRPKVKEEVLKNVIHAVLPRLNLGALAKAAAKAGF